MRRLIPSPATVIAVIALFVALTGTGYADRVVQVLTAQFANDSERVDGFSAGRKARPNRLLALNTNGKFPASVFPSSLHGKAGKTGKTGPAGPAGPQGPKGDTGAQGPAGPPGPAGAAGVAGQTGPAGASADTTYAVTPEQLTLTPSVEAYPATAQGPQVTVDVPDVRDGDGFIQVWVQTLFTDVDDSGVAGAVALYDITGGAPGVPVAGQSDFCVQGAPGIGVSLFVAGSFDDQPIVQSSPGIPASFSGCATIGPPSAVMLRATAGRRTFALKYANCGCGGDAVFESRQLWVQPVTAAG